jgi:glycerophosphoryl diester phosphodiesterase
MPENSLLAFEHALELGVDTIELDTVVTADGVVVVYQDPFLNPERVRKSGQFITERILIKNLTLSWLREYDIGSIAEPGKWPDQLQVDGQIVPTLEEVIRMVDAHNAVSEKKVRLNIEIKGSPLEPELTIDLREHVEGVMDLVERYGIGEFVIIQSFFWKALKIVDEIDGNVLTAALVSSINLDKTAWTDGLRLRQFGFDIGKMLASIGVDIVAPSYTIMADGWIQSAHEAGLEIIPWTVNDTSEMKRLIELGVDGIITDYPDRLIKLFR